MDTEEEQRRRDCEELQRRRWVVQRELSRWSLSNAIERRRSASADGGGGGSDMSTPRRGGGGGSGMSTPRLRTLREATANGSSAPCKGTTSNNPIREVEEFLASKPGGDCSAVGGPHR